MVLNKIPQSEVQAPGIYNSRATINASIAVVSSVERHSKINGMTTIPIVVHY